MEYQAELTYNSHNVKMQYTTEKKVALRRAVSSNAVHVNQCIADLTEIRSFVEKRTTLTDIHIVDKLTSIKRLLSHYRGLSEQFKSELYAV